MGMIGLADATTGQVPAVTPVVAPAIPTQSFASDFLKGIQFSPLAIFAVTSLIAQPRQTLQTLQTAIKNNPGEVAGAAAPWVALLIWWSSRDKGKR